MYVQAAPCQVSHITCQVQCGVDKGRVALDNRQDIRVPTPVEQKPLLLCRTGVGNNGKEVIDVAYSVQSKKTGQTYYLHMRNVTLRGGRNQTIYFFARAEGEGALDELPTGMMVMENDRTGLPMLKKADKK